MKRYTVEELKLLCAQYLAQLDNTEKYEDYCTTQDAHTIGSVSFLDWLELQGNTD